MFHLLLFSGLLVFALPLALLGGMAYLFFSLFSVVLKTAGAAVGIVLAVIFGVMALVGVVLFSVFCLPFWAFF